MDRQTILIVDDEPTNIKLLSRILQRLYKIRVAKNGYEALERVMIEPKPSLILLDVMMPGMDGYTLCRKLKSKKETSSIPVIFITSKSDVKDEAKGFDSGAVDYINKPISSPLVLARVKSHITLAGREKTYESIIYERTSELHKTQEAAISMLGEAGHYNDTDTGLHIWRMAAYAKEIAGQLEWPIVKAEMLELAAPLHDTGKIGIPDSILKAPRQLTNKEWNIMKQHTTIGHSILSKSKTPLFQLAAEIALYHHERWDGKGYPKGLKGNDIPESSRIIAVADVFDALTMVRPYKSAWSIQDAINEIKKESGTHFDPDIVEAFTDLGDCFEIIKTRFDNLQV